MRGVLTDEIQNIARTKLGREITRDELRLMAYVQFVMMNKQRIDPRKCNPADREVLSLWRRENHIEGGASGLAVTKEFWDVANEILWLGYVAHAASDELPVGCGT